MKSEIKKYERFFAEIYAKRMLFLSSEKEKEYLTSLGFTFSIVRDENLVECSYPDGWSIKPRWYDQPSIASIADHFQRERAVLAFQKWREDQISCPEFKLMPRFQIWGPVGCVHNWTTRVFVEDGGYPFKHPKNFLTDRSLKITQREKNKSQYVDGPTAISLLQKVKAEMEQKYPDYKNPEAYWDEVHDIELDSFRTEEEVELPVRKKRY
jgi:hypothetical protein